jgi:hypothetical protein
VARRAERSAHAPPSGGGGVREQDVHSVHGSSRRPV